jgi:hypothetical protein
MDSDAKKSPEWVSAVVAEYQAHRAEVVSEAEAQQQTLALGATAVGIVIAGAFNVWGNRVLVSVAFLGIVPLLCLFVLIQWVGRAAGLMWVGGYLQDLEDAFREAHPTAPLKVFVWERTLAARQMRRGPWWSANYQWHDYGAVAIFALIAYGSIALGAYRLYATQPTAAIALLTIESLVLTGVAVQLLREVSNARTNVRKDSGAGR